MYSNRFCAGQSEICMGSSDMDIGQSYLPIRFFTSYKNPSRSTCPSYPKNPRPGPAFTPSLTRWRHRKNRLPGGYLRQPIIEAIAYYGGRWPGVAYVAALSGTCTQFRHRLIMIT